MLVTRIKSIARDTNFWTGLGVIVLAIFIYVASFDIQEFIATRVGASFMPRIAAVLFAILGIILIAGSARCAREGIVRDEPEDNEENLFGGLPAVLLSALLMCAYVGLMDSLGFIITSAIYIFLQILILAKDARRNYLLFAIISIVVPIATYLLFVQVFKVMIPAGILS